MFDFKAYFQIVKSTAQSTAKAVHKPSLCNKESMAAYARTIGATGNKASFVEQSDMIEWSV